MWNAFRKVLTVLLLHIERRAGSENNGLQTSSDRLGKGSQEGGAYSFFPFFLQNTNCIRKPPVFSGRGGGGDGRGVRIPCSLPLDPSLEVKQTMAGATVKTGYLSVVQDAQRELWSVQLLVAHLKINDGKKNILELDVTLTTEYIAHSRVVSHWGFKLLALINDLN